MSAATWTLPARVTQQNIRMDCIPRRLRRHRAWTPQGKSVQSFNTSTSAPCQSVSVYDGTFPLHTVLYISRTSSSVCCSPTQLGPKAFRWTTTNAQNRPTRPRGRQFSLQFSRQSSKGSVRSLPSPKALGRRRRSLARFQSRQSPGPPCDTLQLPDPEYNHDFQGTTGAEDEDKEGDDRKTTNSQSHSLDKI